MTIDSAAQSPTISYSSPPVTIILTILFLVFFFVGFFSIYFCRCFLENLLHSWYLRRNSTGTSVGPACPIDCQGLNPAIKDSFPTFTYSSVKEMRQEKYGLECAICLSEFVDDDILRLFTICCHVFHQECVDLWLESHKTCPVCRKILDSTGKSPEKSPTTSNYIIMREINENEPLEDTFSITITDDYYDERRQQQREGEAAVTPADTSIHSDEQSSKKNSIEKFPRSHSTGHSIVRINTSDQEDRFTLRLPEHLHAKLLRVHNWTGSCTTFGEYKSKTSTGHGGFGEVSDFYGGDVNRT